MANANTSIKLEVLHSGIEKAIRRQFPTLMLVEFYREEENRDALPAEYLPACLLEITEFDPASDEDPGTEQLAVNARFEARLIIGFRTARAKIEIRRLACAFAAWLHKNKRFHGLPTGPLEVTAIVPDDFSPELDRYEVWRVEWMQPLHLGESIWTDEGITPETPLYKCSACEVTG